MAAQPVRSPVHALRPAEVGSDGIEFERRPLPGEKVIMKPPFAAAVVVSLVMAPVAASAADRTVGDNVDDAGTTK